MASDLACRYLLVGRLIWDTPQAGVRENDGVTRRALLIGSQTYGLRGCNADVALMREVLAARDFEVDVRVDGDATRAGVLDGFEQALAVGWVEPTGPTFGRPYDKLSDTHQSRRYRFNRYRFTR